MRQDYRSKPFVHYVAIGDSITAGGCATRKEYCWVSRLAAMISEMQGAEMKLSNRGIGANVLTDAGPVYERSVKPSGLERYRRDIVSLSPDLVTLAFGFNDIRGGSSPERLGADMDRMIQRIRAGCDALIVVLSLYHINSYASVHDPFWSKANRRIFRESNKILRLCAKKNDALFADVYDAMGEAAWTIDRDGIHPNNLGHLLIAGRVFETLAIHCSCLSIKPFQDAAAYAPWQDETYLIKPV